MTTIADKNLSLLGELRRATIDACVRTGKNDWESGIVGTCVGKGLFMVTVNRRVGRKFVEERLTGFLPIEDAIAYLKAMQP
jgi:hypothetical protein